MILVGVIVYGFICAIVLGYGAQRIVDGKSYHLSTIVGVALLWPLALPIWIGVSMAENKKLEDDHADALRRAGIRSGQPSP